MTLNQMARESSLRMARRHLEEFKEYMELALECSSSNDEEKASQSILNKLSNVERAFVHEYGPTKLVET